MNKSFKLEDIEEVVKDLLDDIQKNSFRVLGFSGDLGAGKTTFTKELLRQLGHAGSVASPTFVLRRDYEAGRKVIHIDAYRLDKPEHIFQVISKDELADKNNLIIVEWPEKSENIFDTIYTFEHIDENTRKISRK
jgi:tRNA threonylcarbamoyladenosine biosynthesis protein TsaE